jgi:REP element-mobilizing transposase RayT
MTSAPPYPQRHALRLPNYDYSQAGAYFITICTHRRLPLLGTIREGVVTLSAAGRIVEEEWLRTPSLRSHVTLDAYVIMPNHIHGILFLQQTATEDRINRVEAGRQSFACPSHTIGAIVRGFKGASTSRIRKLSPRENVQVWQREYYDHVIRDERDLDRIREYIQNNPLKWELDRYYLRMDGSL